MLGDGDGLAEPADVAEVGEDRRRLLLGDEARRQLLAEQVLVADVGRDPLAADHERGRPQPAAVEVAEGDVHHLGEPAKAGRDELAERHQVVLVVAIEAARQVGGRRRDAGRRVGVAQLLVAERQADQRRPTGLAKAIEQPLPPGRVELLGQERNDGLRADHQVAAGAFELRRGRGQRLRHVAGGELLFLRHVALQQRHRERAGRPGVVDAAGDGAERERRQQQPCGRRARRAATPSRLKPKAAATPATIAPEPVDADPGREAAERRIDVRIAARHPGKAGEDHAAGELGEQPGAGEHRGRRPAATSGASAPPPPSPRRGRGRERRRARTPPAPPAPPPGRRSGAC